MKSIFTIFLFFSFALVLSGQTLIATDSLNQEYTTLDSIESNFGVNKTHFLHTYVGYAFSGGGTGAPIIYGKSAGYIWGLRYKYKINEIFAFGLGLNYASNNFLLKQNSTKTFPTAAIHLKEKFTFNQLGSEAYGRINFDKNRGNKLGVYIDLGGYINWVFFSKYFIKDNNPNKTGTGAQYIETAATKLNYTHQFNNGYFIKVGYEKMALTVKYRTSNLFIEGYNYPELPRFLFGIEIISIM